MSIEELENKHGDISLEPLNFDKFYYKKHTKLSVEFAIEQLNDLKLYDGGEMQSMSESIYNSIFNSQIEDKIQKLKQYLNE